MDEQRDGERKKRTDQQRKSDLFHDRGPDQSFSSEGDEAGANDGPGECMSCWDRETRASGEEDPGHRPGQDRQGNIRSDDCAGLDKAMAEGFDHRAGNKGSQCCADHGPNCPPDDSRPIVSDAATDQGCDGFWDVVGSVGEGKSEHESKGEQGDVHRSP